MLFRSGALCEAGFPELEGFTFGTVAVDTLSPEVSRRLLESPWFARLTTLELLSCLDREVLAWGLKQGKFQHLQDLRLANRDPETLKLILDAPWGALRSLELMNRQEAVPAAMREACFARFGSIVEFEFPSSRWSPTVHVKATP